MGPVIVGPVYFTNQYVYQVFANAIGVVLEFGTNPVSEYAVPLHEVLAFCKWWKVGAPGGFSKNFVCSAEFASMKEAAARSSVYFSTTLCPDGGGTGRQDRWLVATASSQQLADQYIEEGATQLMQANPASPSNAHKLVMNALQAAPGRACSISALFDRMNGSKFRRARLHGEPIASAHAGLLKLQLYTVPVPVPFFIRCS